MSPLLAAVDLGASSGRVIVGRLQGGALGLEEAARFPTASALLGSASGARRHWDILHTYNAIADGLRGAAHDIGPLDSVGIDTWAVDYGLLDSAGELVGNPASYRCARTEGAPERFFAQLPAAEMYRRVGVQVQPFNTVFQLLVESDERLQIAEQLLLLPDLLGYWLTGQRVTEVTNASSTGLLDPGARQWHGDVLAALRDGFDRDVERLLAPLVEPGTVVGPVNASGLELTTADGVPTPLVAVGSHDTASAVVAVPAEGQDFAYISCGTWSLVGLELDAPVRSEAARAANLTNELGVDGTVRFLKNVMGLWVFNEAVRTWRSQRIDVDVPELVKQAASCEPLRTVIDIDAPEFFPPGGMPARIQEAARRTGQPVPGSPAEVSRCIFDSLALAYRRSIRQTADIADHEVSVVHMVGGGIQNTLLCQLTADATGLPVVAGPVEGTALGNLVVQARAIGALEGGLPELRDVVRASSEMVSYRPEAGAESRWSAAERRLG